MQASRRVVIDLVHDDDDEPRGSSQGVRQGDWPNPLGQWVPQSQQEGKRSQAGKSDDYSGNGPLQSDKTVASNVANPINQGNTSSKSHASNLIQRRAKLAPCLGGAGHWLSWHPGAALPLDEFLALATPSSPDLVRMFPDLAWVSVESPAGHGRPGERGDGVELGDPSFSYSKDPISLPSRRLGGDDKEEDTCAKDVGVGVKSLKKESVDEVLRDVRQYPGRVMGKEVKMEFVRRILGASRELSGKWMYFPTWDHVDDLWGRVARAAAQGRLPGCCSAKVAPHKPSYGSSSGRSGSGGGSLICVYVADWSDTASVESLLRALWRIQPVKHGFKPDAFTSAGLYSRGAAVGMGMQLHPNLAKLPLTIYGEMRARVQEEMEEEEAARRWGADAGEEGEEGEAASTGEIRPEGENTREAVAGEGEGDFRGRTSAEREEGRGMVAPAAGAEARVTVDLEDEGVLTVEADSPAMFKGRRVQGGVGAKGGSEVATEAGAEAGVSHEMSWVGREGEIGVAVGGKPQGTAGGKGSPSKSDPVCSGSRHSLQALGSGMVWAVV
eukprot:jgi/Mesvir1/28251/Mv04790-RA.1